MLPILKQYLIARFSLRDCNKAQLILNKYTLRKHNIPEERLEEENNNKPSSDLQSPVKSDLTNGSVDKQDSFNVTPILEKIKKKRRSFLFSPLKINPTEGIGKLDSTRKENINTLNSGKLTNGSVNNSDSNVLSDRTRTLIKTSVDEINSVTDGKTESSDQIGTSNLVEPVRNSGIAIMRDSLSQTVNEVKTLKNVRCDNNGVSNGFEIPNVHEVEACLHKPDIKVKTLDLNSSGAKSVVGLDEVDVKAIFQKAKPKKIKNLFGVPAVPI